MPSIQIDWLLLQGQTLQTINGAPFRVVRVTEKYVTVRPLRGSRNYAFSIPDELERGVVVYAGASTFPTPAELGRIGIRPILASYSWGVLKAVLVDGIGLRAVPKSALRDFAETWVITETRNQDDMYAAGELEPLRLQLHVSGGLTTQVESRPIPLRTARPHSGPQPQVGHQFVCARVNVLKSRSNPKSRSHIR